jgi:hypothetical protein
LWCRERTSNAEYLAVQRDGGSDPARAGPINNHAQTNVILSGAKDLPSLRCGQRIVRPFTPQDDRKKRRAEDGSAAHVVREHHLSAGLAFGFISGAAAYFNWIGDLG